MASLAEQIRLLSNPEPKRLDLDDDEFDVTRAQVIDKSNKYENAESQIVQSTTTLLKKTVPLLQDEDMKYAGRKISRAQLEASRDDSDSPGFKNGKQFHGDSDGDKHGDSSEDEDVSNSTGNESDVDGIKDENLCRKLTFESSEDNSHTEKGGKSMETGVVLHEGADENDVLESADSQKGILSFSEDKDSDDDRGNEKNDSDKDEDEDEEEETDSHGDIQNFSLAGLKEDLEKGKAAKNQIGLWDSFLEIRIRFQKALLLANKLPQKDKLAPFKSSGDKNLIETYKQGRKSVVDLLENLLLIQEKLLEENPDTRNVLYPGTSSTNSKDNDDNNEEIPSDSEEEKSANDGDVDREELANGRGEEETLKLPSKRKQTLDASEYGEYICKRHAAFKSYRDATISKWSEKTRLASGKLNSKSFSSFNRSALAQINQILSDKGRLLKRTQLKRSNYRVLGKTEDNETQESWPKQEQTDMHLKDYDAEIFDDDDFYHQLLREFIEQRTGGGTDNPIEMGRQWLQLQRLRRRVRKQVDRKASKGRKIRYDVHPKLVSFMAPIEKGPMVDSSRNELFSSLFGARQPQQESDISVFR